MSKQEAQKNHVPIAIVGMGCMFPKAPDLKSYWSLIRRGKDAISEIPETHWSPDDYFDPDPKRPDFTYSKRGGFLSELSFDPTEFGIPPTTLEATDTAQLFALVAAKRALEDAGYDEKRDFDRDRVSVVMGVTGTLELVIPLGARLGHPIWRKALLESGLSAEKSEEIVQRISEGYVPWQESSFPGLLGNVVAGRIASRLDLGGTNCVVDAACASSLSAMHLACLELMAGKSDMVITGGVDTLNDIFMYMCFSKTPALSPTGDARPFSSDADGTAICEGVGVVVLKRLDDAERDNDRIYAVIKGVGSSSDGRSQSIYAPRAAGQQKAIRRAYESAGVSAESIQLLEAHGTGTKVGDAVEFDSLKQVYGDIGRDDSWCALGAVKSQIGHSKSAAGAASVIKTALSLFHKTLPPTIKVDKPNPKLGIEESSFYLNTEARPWISGGEPRRAGVSSFGFGGSNFHIVLEEYKPEKEEIAWDGDAEFILFSADTRQGLQKKFSDWKQKFTTEKDPYEKLLVIVETRQEFEPSAAYRLGLMLHEEKAPAKLFEQVEKIIGEKEEKLTQTKTLFYYPKKAQQELGKIGFLFPGQGSQYVGMGKELCAIFPACFDTVQNAERQFLEEQGVSLTQRIFPKPVFTDEDKKEQSISLADTAFAQPAIGAVSLGMLRILESFGLQADATAGHSYGELVALCAAGRMSEQDLIRLSQKRGELMAKGDKDRGTMLAVSAPLKELEALLKTTDINVTLANRNSPTQGVLSGSKDDISKIEKLCLSKGFRVKKLPVSAAFHSSLVADAQKPFREFLETIEFSESKIPVYSNTLAAPYPESASGVRDLLAKQLLSTVDFVGEIEAMYESGVRTFVEIGPKTILGSLVGAILKEKEFQTFSLDRTRGKRDGHDDLAALLMQLSVAGIELKLSNWEKLPIRRRKQRMSIPLTGANYRSPKKKSKFKKQPIAEPNSEKSISQKKAVSKSPEAAPSQQRSLQKDKATRSVHAKMMQPSDQMTARQSTNLHSVSFTSQRFLEQDVTQQSVPKNGSYPRMSQHKPNFSKQNGSSPHASQQFQQSPAGQKNPVYQAPPQSAVAGSQQVYISAFQMMQEGLRSMQAFQMQTALNHQRFLEGQDAAHQALQRMLMSSQGLVEAALGMPKQFIQGASQNQTAQPRQQHVTPAPISHFPQAEWGNQAPVQAPAQAQSFGQPQYQAQASVAYTNQPKQQAPTQATFGTQGVTAAYEVSIPQPQSFEGVAQTQFQGGEMHHTLHSLPQAQVNPSFYTKETKIFEKPVQVPAPAFQAEVKPVAAPTASVEKTLSREKVEQIILEVVGELTGYPVEMLSFEMDMEADLGIDSIKRVEILSTVSEKMPAAGDVNPDAMGSLRTLEEVIDALMASQAESSTSSEAVAIEAASSPEINVKEILINVVAELTGYPEEMISLEMDMEADLGIDSIKRVEILSQVTEQVPQMASVDAEQLRSLRTLEEIVNALPESKEGVNPFDQASLQSAATEERSTEQAEKPLELDLVKRRFLKAVPQAQQNVQNLKFQKGAKVIIIGQKDELQQTLSDAFEQKNLKVDSLRFGDVLKSLDSVAGIVLLPFPLGQASWDWSSSAQLKQAFLYAKEVRSQLLTSATKGDAFFASISRMDGQFGLSKDQDFSPIQGGIAGLVKTFGLENEGIQCKALDVDANLQEHKQIGDSLVKELLSKGSNEVGFSSTERFVLQMEQITREDSSFAMPFNESDVVIVSGGARGVTAAVTLAMASEVQATYILLGRSPAPSDEPSWLLPLEKEAVIKKALLKNGYQGEALRKPVDLQKAYQTICKNREIRGNLQKLADYGAKVLYHSMDVRDRSALSDAFAQYRKEHGAIRVIVHAAGVLEDKRIEEKSLEQFEKVYDTKVDGLAALLEASKQDELASLILFSSVSGRAGNLGQVDYSMANEVLNKAAQKYAKQYSQCRVLSLNWGPWDGGMVSPALKKHFTNLGVQLIPLREGAYSCIHEMSTKESAVEVILGDIFEEPALEEIPATTKAKSKKANVKAKASSARPKLKAGKSALRRSFTKKIGVESYPILKDHQIGGFPVVPLALMTEWLGHAALHHHPGFQLLGYQKVRVLNGIRLTDGAVDINVLAGELVPEKDNFIVDVEIRSNRRDGSEQIHAKGKAVLGNGLAQAGETSKKPLKFDADYPCSVEESYQEILFHGSKLQGIESVLGFSKKGISLKTSSAPAPKSWIKNPLRKRWLHDPLVVDCAFQAAILWCFEVEGLVSLPSYFQSMQIYRPFGKGSTKIILAVKERMSSKMKGDFLFFDEKDQLIAEMKGYECTMDASLYDAFHAPTQ